MNNRIVKEYLFPPHYPWSEEHGFLKLISMHKGAAVLGVRCIERVVSILALVDTSETTETRFFNVMVTGVGTNVPLTFQIKNFVGSYIYSGNPNFHVFECELK